MESSQRDLFIDMVFDRFIFVVTKLRSPHFTFIPKTDTGLSKTGVGFHCEGSGVVTSWDRISIDLVSWTGNLDSDYLDKGKSRQSLWTVLGSLKARFTQTDLAPSTR